MKEIAKHCYLQNMDLSGPHGFRDEHVLCFSYCKTMGTNDPRGVDNFDPRGMTCRIYVGYQDTLLYTKYKCFRLCGLREDSFFMFSHYKPMVDNDASVAWPIRAQGTWLAGFMNIATHII